MVQRMKPIGQVPIRSTQRRLRVLASALRDRIRRSTLWGISTFEPVGPTEILPRAPAVCDADQFDRVLACGFDLDVKAEIASLASTTFSGTPAECCRLGECTLVGGTIVTAQGRHLLRSLPEWRSLLSRMESYDQATLLNTMQGLHYFGHWLQDDCPLYESLRSETVLLSMPRPHWPDCRVYENAFGQDWKQTDFAHVGDLTIWRELGYNRDKAARITELRGRLRRAVTARSGGQPVYISRGKPDEPRNMSNVTAFKEAMRKAGIAVLDPGIGNAEMVQQMLDAPLVIAIEGSQACHGLYTLAEGGSFLILQPPERFYNPLHNWAALLGMGYGLVIGRKDGTRFHIDPDEVLRIADRLLAR